MMSGMEVPKVLGAYFRDGRLVALPRRRAARLAVLDLLAGQFEPGREYPEPTVNAVLAHFYPDFSALRRYMVDEQFMERRGGVYWRAGGTFDLD